MSGIIDTVGSKSGIVGSDIYPAGHVVQTKTGVHAVSLDINFDTNTWNSVGLTVTIDPIYANSKILVSWVCNVFVIKEDGNMGCGFRMDRTGPSSSTVYTTGQIGAYSYHGSYLSGTHQIVDTFAGSAIDLPASTATCSYVAKINDNACNYVTAQYASAPTNIILQEIKVL
jgi:hypothetical protein